MQINYVPLHRMIALQYFIISIIILVAFIFLFRKIKSEFTSGSCDTGCGKCAAAKSFDSING